MLVSYISPLYNNIINWMPYAIPIDIVVVGWLSAIYPAYIYILPYIQATTSLMIYPQKWKFPTHYQSRRCSNPTHNYCYCYMGSFIPNTSRGLKFLPIKEAIKNTISWWCGSDFMGHFVWPVRRIWKKQDGCRSLRGKGCNCGKETLLRGCTILYPIYQSPNIISDITFHIISHILIFNMFHNENRPI